MAWRLQRRVRMGAAWGVAGVALAWLAAGTVGEERPTSRGGTRHASPAVTASVYADVLEANREGLGAKLAQAGFGA